MYHKENCKINFNQYTGNTKKSCEYFVPNRGVKGNIYKRKCSSCKVLNWWKKKNWISSEHVVEIDQ